MPIYSYSKLSTFEQCQLKFKFRYLDYIQPDFEETIESFLGKKVHKALQWIYTNSNSNIDKNPELDDVISYFIESWNKDFNHEIKITNSLPVENYFNKGIRFIINYYTKNYPFKDNTIALEKKIFINLGPEKNYQLIGYIDRLVKNENIFEIHDYKTGYLKSVKDLDNNSQLALYSLAVKDSFENVEDIFLVWHFLGYNQEIRSKVILEDLEKLKKNTIELINKIESTLYFHPNPGKLCNWCEFQSKCPAFKEYKEKIY